MKICSTYCMLVGWPAHIIHRKEPQRIPVFKVRILSKDVLLEKEVGEEIWVSPPRYLIIRYLV